MKSRYTRRSVLKLGLAGGGGLALGGLAACGESAPVAGADGAIPGAARLLFDFSGGDAAQAWGARWHCSGVASLLRGEGKAELVAGTDVFPSDPRPVAFLRDSRMLEGRVRAVISNAGTSVGVVLRRQSVRDYYAAIYDTGRNQLQIVRRSGFELAVLAAALVPPTALPDLLGDGEITLELAVEGARPTRLAARLRGAEGLVYSADASDSTELLQQPGEAGVLALADTLLPGRDDAIVPALGNLRLLAYGVQEGQVILQSPVGEALFGVMRQRSTAGFRTIEIASPQAFLASVPRAIAATTGAPVAGGVCLQVACDMPAEVSFEIADGADFANSRRVAAGMTDAFDAVSAVVGGLQPRAMVWWRPVVRGNGVESLGPARRLRVLPAAGAAGEFSFAVGSCSSRFGPIFDQLTARQPDVLIWQGDLNYPDTMGPYAQTVEGYAGIWRHFLDNPRLTPLLERAHFVCTRDDHDYGVQDANAATLLPWGVQPWESLMNPRTYQLLSMGVVDVWMLDQRKFKSDPELPDTVDKTLLGAEQREWLLRTLAASTAPFKVICSPVTLAPSGAANARDGSWAAGYTAERDLLLAHLAAQVSGQTIFLTGDTHFTMLWDKDGLIEQRACPLDIPLPNDISIANPDLELGFGSTAGVVYWSRRSHFSWLGVSAGAGGPVLTLELVREDGVVVQSRRFEAA